MPLRSVHPEDSPDHAQEQGQLQEDQEQEVDIAEPGPVGDTVTGNELPPLEEVPGPFQSNILFQDVLSLQVCPDPFPGLQVLSLLGSSSSLFVVSLAPFFIRDLFCYSRKYHKGEPS